MSLAAGSDNQVCATRPADEKAGQEVGGTCSPVNWLSTAIRVDFLQAILAILDTEPQIITDDPEFGDELLPQVTVWACA